MDNNVVLLRPQAPITSDETATIVALREQGLSLSQIAKRTKIPKSTVERRLKSMGVVASAEPTGNPIPSHEAASHPIPQSPSHETTVPTSEAPPRPTVPFVQNFNETKENRPASPAPRSSHGTASRPVPQAAPSHRSWADLARTALLLAPVAALSPWLVATSAEVYSREVGERWGWWLAVGFECFFLALAALAPRIGIRVSSPREFWASLPRVAKSLGWYAVLAGMAAYSFHAMTLGVTEGRATALATVAATASTSAEITDLREERAQLANTISRYESQGWLGEARKLRDDLRVLGNRIEAARERATTATPATLASIEHRTSVGRYLRLCALLINVFCLHLAVRMWSRSTGAQA